MGLKITLSGQTIVKPTALGPVANTDTKFLIYGLFQKGRVLAQDGIRAGDSCRGNPTRDVRDEAFRADPTPRCWQRRALKPHHLAARFELETST